MASMMMETFEKIFSLPFLSEALFSRRFFCSCEGSERAWECFLFAEGEEEEKLAFLLRAVPSPPRPKRKRPLLEKGRGKK